LFGSGRPGTVGGDELEEDVVVLDVPDGTLGRLSGILGSWTGPTLGS
jgi:hypothetical protein